MKQKSRVCSPSPKMVDGSFFRADVMNLGMTARRVLPRAEYVEVPEA